VSAKLPSLVSAFVLLSEVAALAQAAVQVGPPGVFPPPPALPPLLQLTPGGTPAPVAPGPSSLGGIGIAPAPAWRLGRRGTCLVGCKIRRLRL
jgi:hypothetical protein